MAAALQSTSLSLHVDGIWPRALSPSVSRRGANTVAVFYTSVDSKLGGEVCLFCLQSTHSSTHPPIGSEINPFSDLLPEDFKPSLKLLALERARSQNEKKKVNPFTDRGTIIQSETKQKLRLLGLSRWSAHLQVSHPLSGCLCEYLTFRH